MNCFIESYNNNKASIIKTSTAIAIIYFQLKLKEYFILLSGRYKNNYTSKRIGEQKMDPVNAALYVYFESENKFGGLDSEPLEVSLAVLIVTHLN